MSNRKRNKTKSNSAQSKRRRPRALSGRTKGPDRRIARQKKAYLSLVGVGASGFGDISVEHDTHLYEKQ
jgi:hypothetical protein